MKFEIDNIELYFGNRQILHGVYLKAETGKITGVLGANGSGKSSLLKLFFGSLNSTHKLVRIDNNPYLKPLFKSGLAKYLAQQSFIPPEMKLKTGFHFFKVSLKKFTHIFPEFKNTEKHRIKEFSSGQRRLIEIYICINSRAKLILLDEPFSHLSPSYIEKIKELLQKLKKEKAIVITDHMYKHILDASDELYLLKNGCSKLIKKKSDLEDYRYLNPKTLQ
ncbi:ABC transporter ATP-binding protein [Salegentibacter maritimus]|uniref:ABC transporter ATP-binding protein n=1 Tax=Salegentibacter maritimus TaxID=2794347 RepID=A0ABS0TGZ2_9FLAO|nr:ABC transporter ATP-binding protein [Salegentibacter maritimus]MBI6120070.1 ABC transporter ATP-binding protein [Salegentibacter maritimus]